MTTIDELQDMGIRLSIQAGRLHAGPAGRIDDDIRELIAANRQTLMEAVLERERALLKEARATIDRLLTKRESALERLQESEETIAKLKREIEYLKADAKLSQLIADGCQMQYQRLLTRQPAIPADIRKALVLLCHPDRQPPNRQPAATKAMTWLNQQRPRAHP